MVKIKWGRIVTQKRHLMIIVFKLIPNSNDIVRILATLLMLFDSFLSGHICIDFNFDFKRKT